MPASYVIAEDVVAVDTGQGVCVSRGVEEEVGMQCAVWGVVGEVGFVVGGWWVGGCGGGVGCDLGRLGRRMWGGRLVSLICVFLAKGWEWLTVCCSSLVCPVDLGRVDDGGDDRDDEEDV